MKLLIILLLALANARTFTIALHQNKAGVKTLEYMLLKHISNPESKNYGNYLSVNQINEFTQAPINHRKAVLDWLHSKNINNCIDLLDSIKCTSSDKYVNEAFQINKIPNEIQKYILFVDGLFNQDNPNNHYIKKRFTFTSPEIDPGLVTREVLMRVYNVNNTDTDPNTSVGSMEFQGISGFSNKDLISSQIQNGVKSNPVANNHIIGTNNSPDGESQLDVQVMYWAASNATLWYEDYKGTHDNGWIYSWSVDFMNRQDVPQVVSLSWGWSEIQQCTVGKCTNETSKQYVDRTNVELMKIGIRGTTVVVASGDAGSPGRTNELCGSKQLPTGWNNINPIFPGGSPFVLSVGASYLLRKGMNNYNKSNKYNKFVTPICQNNQCATGSTEQCCTFNQTGWTSGSGFTHWNPTPSWQLPYVQKYLKSGIHLPNSIYFNSTNRAYPDVTAFGHNCAVVNNGQVGPADGTSCAAPIFAGVIANLNAYQLSKGRPLLGFVNPLLYKIYGLNPNTFNDILVGDSSCTEAECCGRNFGFLAGKGWDPVSGLGSPNIGEIKRMLDKL